MIFQHLLINYIIWTFKNAGDFFNAFFVLAGCMYVHVLIFRRKKTVTCYARNFSGTHNRWEFCRSMRDRTNACVPRDVSRDKRGKFCKHLKGFKTKINRMNEENFAAFFVLLAFIQLSFTVTSLTGKTNSNKRETRALAEQKNGKGL